MSSSRPTIGLVLTGGGVRGLAHVGVLQALQRIGLQPDVIVGVSMGAVVGSTAAAREDWVKAMATVDRRRLPAFTDANDDGGVARLRSLMSSARQMAPSVLTWGRQGVEDYARATLESLLDGTPTFSDLRIPLAVVATDLDAGTRAVLTDGDVADAVLASCAIPGILAPRRMDGRTLIDGSFADPVPVDVAREMGAEVVIAVDVGSSMPVEFGDSWATVLLRGLEIGHRRLAATRLDDADVVLRPDFGDRVHMLNFSHIDVVVKCGYTCGRDAAKVLGELVALPGAEEVRGIDEEGEAEPGAGADEPPPGLD